MVLNWHTAGALLRTVTMTKWTREVPVKAGYYWCRDKGYGPVIQEVLDDGGELFVFDGYDDHSISEWGGEWWPKVIQAPND